MSENAILLDEETLKEIEEAKKNYEKLTDEQKYALKELFETPTIHGEIKGFVNYTISYKEARSILDTLIKLPESLYLKNEVLRFIRQQENIFEKQEKMLELYKKLDGLIISHIREINDELYLTIRKEIKELEND